MKYEVPREAFKQRLGDRLNFLFVDMLPENRTPAKFADSVHMKYGTSFKDEFLKAYPNKNQNIMLYSLERDDHSPAMAADVLSQEGYNFVYFYKGSPEDVVLDKGLN